MKSPHMQVLTRAKIILLELCQLSPFALQSIMTVIDQGYDLPLEAAFEFEATHFGLTCTTADKKVGVTAFLEIRPAVFSGE